MTSISHLPNEIMTSILSRLDPMELRLARQVSPSWEALIDEVIGLEITIGTPNGYTRVKPETAVWEEIDIIETLGVQTCTIGDLEDVQGPPFKHPQVVRDLRFEGPLTSFTFVTLLSPLPALQSLTLHFCALESVHLDEKILISTCLKTFKLTSHGIFSTNRSRRGAERVLKNALIFLKTIRSKFLSACLIDLPFLPEYETRLTISMFKLISRHCDTLRNLQYYFGTTFDIPHGLAMTQFSRTISPENQITIDKGLKSARNFKRVSLALPLKCRLSHLWKELIGRQRGLQEIFFMSDVKGIDTGLKCIQLQCANLTKLLFHVNGIGDDKRKVVLDCEAFSGCVNLTHFLLRGRPSINRNGPFEVINPGLKNTEKLPKKIRLLSLREIDLEGGDVGKLTFGLRDLLKLRLVDTGSQGGLGMSPITLWNLLNEEELLEIEIVRSFNEDGFRNCAYPNIFMHCLVAEVMECWSLHVIWSEEHEAFVQKREEMFVYHTPDNQLRANDVCDEVFK